jgi:hypothetical protein
LALPTTITKVVGILQIVFTNPIIAAHGNRITYQPLISPMAIGRCKNANVVHLRGGY